MARKKSLIKDLSACETVIMKVIWDAVDDIALQQLIVDLREQYGKDYVIPVISQKMRYRK